MFLLQGTVFVILLGPGSANPRSVRSLRSREMSSSIILTYVHSDHRARFRLSFSLRLSSWGLGATSSASLVSTTASNSKHDAYIPMPSGDFPTEMFIYGGPESIAVDKGIYYDVAVHANVRDDDASLQLYANCVCASPFSRVCF